MAEGAPHRRSKIWLIITAVFAIVTVGALWASAELSQAKIERAASESSDNYTRRAEHNITLRCPLIPASSFDRCAAEEHDAANEAKRNAHNLEAQQKIAVWTGAIARVTVVGTVIGLFGLVLLFTTFREARRAADAGFKANGIAERAMQDSEAALDASIKEAQSTAETSKAVARCYISVKNITLHNRNTLGFEIQNIGNTPARFAYLSLDAAWCNEEGAGGGYNSMHGKDARLLDRVFPANSVVKIGQEFSSGGLVADDHILALNGSIIYCDIFGDWFASGFQGRESNFREGPARMITMSGVMPRHIPFDKPAEHAGYEETVRQRTWKRKT